MVRPSPSTGHAFNSLQLINGAVLTHSANTATETHKLDLTVTGEVVVDSTSRIDVGGKGYLPGRTAGNTAAGGATGRAGGSYGGSGLQAGSPTNVVYGSYALPDDSGSGGGGPEGSAEDSSGSAPER